MENICSELRYLPIAQTLAQDCTLLILCDLSYSNSDAVEVAMVSASHQPPPPLRPHLSPPPQDYELLASANDPLLPPPHL